MPKSKKSMMKSPDSEGPKSLSVAYNIQKTAGRKMAKGGMVEPAPTSEEMPHPADLMPDEERASSIADAIMRKRETQKFAEGGMVDLDANAEESPADLDDLNSESLAGSQPGVPNLKENYSEGDDMISKIRKSLKAKRGF